MQVLVTSERGEGQTDSGWAGHLASGNESKGFWDGLCTRGRKRKMGRYVMIDSDRKRKWAWFRLIPAVLPAARPQPVICARVEEDVEFMKPYPFTQRLRSCYSSAVYVCVCVCVVRGLPRSNGRFSPTVRFPLKTSSHCSTSATRSRPRTSKRSVSLDCESSTHFRKAGSCHCKRESQVDVHQST